MFINLVRVDANPQKRQEYIQTLYSLADSIRNINGCISHHSYQNIENEDTFCLIQEWESREALEAFLCSELFLVFQGAVDLLSTSHQMISDEGEKIDKKGSRQ